MEKVSTVCFAGADGALAGAEDGAWLAAPEEGREEAVLFGDTAAEEVIFREETES